MLVFQFGNPKVKPFDFLDDEKMNLSQKLDDPGLCLVHATHYGHRRFRFKRKGAQAVN